MPVIAIENTENQKIGNASTTYSGLNTCPSDCPLRKGGCYGMCGPVGIIFRRLSDMKRSHIREAKSEAAGILKLSGEKDLRIHTTGDCRSNESAKIISSAAQTYTKIQDRKAWTFTHAWKAVSRKSWGKVSVLASCETLKQVKQAKAKGYATALVVKEFKSDKLYIEAGQKVMPCPNQVAKAKGEKVTCTRCRLCLNDERLKAAGITIALKIHGPTLKAAKALASCCEG